jgi:regulator of sigma E protease
VKLTFNTSEGTKDATLTFTQADHEAVMERLHYLVGLPLAYRTKTQVAKNAWDAVLMGMDHTKKFVLNVYMTLAGLVVGTVDPSNLHGIVGITKVGYDVQERGPVWLWYLLAMVSVNLAVANFLPLPIVDGGLFLLLVVEKIRGKPLSVKVQTAIQTVGIVLLAGLFLFVTYNDITGLFMK